MRFLDIKYSSNWNNKVTESTAPGVSLKYDYFGIKVEQSVSSELPALMGSITILEAIQLSPLYKSAILIG